MKNKYLLICLALIALVQLNCKRPTEDMIINVDSGIFKYQTTFQLVDPANRSKIIANPVITIDGRDGANIYDISGTKAVKYNDGKVVLGVHPKFDPTTTGAADVKYNVKISAPGYLDVTEPVTLLKSHTQRTIVIEMVSPATPPPAAAAVQQTAPLANNTTTAPIVATTTTNPTVSTTTAVTVPTGTQFRDAAGATISGGNVALTVVNFDVDNPAALQLVPGGLGQTNVTNAPANKTNVFFTPAGFAEIDMKVNATSVKTFNQPINVTVNLDAARLTAVGGSSTAPVSIYSFDLATGQWRFEQAATPVLLAGRPVVNFSTNHLSTFMINIDNNRTTCTNEVSLTIHTGSYPAGISDPFIVDVIDGGNIIQSFYTRLESDNSPTNVMTFQNLPAGNISIEVYRVDYNTYDLAAGATRNGLNRVGQLQNQNLCNTASNQMTVTIPGQSYLTASGVAKCPNKDLTLTASEGAPVYYKLSNTADQFRLLGYFINGGVFKSSLLTVGQKYDFKGDHTYNGKTVAIGRAGVEVTGSVLDHVHIMQATNDFCK